ncbi:hypothetical protein CXG49_19150, partial [Pseudomonas guariconensis]
IEKLGDWCPGILPNQEVFFRISLIYFGEVLLKSAPGWRTDNCSYRSVEESGLGDCVLGPVAGYDYVQSWTWKLRPTPSTHPALFFGITRPQKS